MDRAIIWSIIAITRYSSARRANRLRYCRCRTAQMRSPKPWCAGRGKGQPVAGNFWETKYLDQMNRTEWEAVCDGCGRCCLHRLQDAETGAVQATNVACKLLDRETARCTDYKHRRITVPDCLRLALPDQPAMSGHAPVNQARTVPNGVNQVSRMAQPHRPSPSR